MLAYTFLLRGQIITVDRSLYTGFGPEINEKPRFFRKLFTRMTLQFLIALTPPSFSQSPASMKAKVYNQGSQISPPKHKITIVIDGRAMTQDSYIKYSHTI